MSSRELYLGPNLTVHRIRNRHDGPTETFVALSYGSARSYSCREKLLQAHPIDSLEEWAHGLAREAG